MKGYSLDESELRDMVTKEYHSWSDRSITYRNISRTCTVRDIETVQHYTYIGHFVSPGQQYVSIVVKVDMVPLPSGKHLAITFGEANPYTRIMTGEDYHHPIIYAQSCSIATFMSVDHVICKEIAYAIMRWQSWLATELVS